MKMVSTSKKDQIKQMSILNLKYFKIKNNHKYVGYTTIFLTTIHDIFAHLLLCSLLFDCSQFIFVVNHYFDTFFEMNIYLQTYLLVTLRKFSAYNIT